VGTLFSNYPNPFNPATTIRFELQIASSVRLSIYDLKGRVVRVLASGDALDRGRHEYRWNGRDDSGNQVAAGVYFYRLDAGGFTETKRMALVK